MGSRIGSYLSSEITFAPRSEEGGPLSPPRPMFSGLGYMMKAKGVWPSDACYGEENNNNKKERKCQVVVQYLNFVHFEMQ